MNILVLGAGFAGVRVALDLSDCLPDSEITIVNDSSYHCYIPDLYSVSATKMLHEDKLSFEDVIESVNIPLKEIFSGTKVKVLVDQVKALDTDKKVVTLGDGDLTYDFLVINLGSSTNYFGVKGAENFSHPLKSVEDALNIHNDLEELISFGKKKLVIAGGGFTGVELAGSLKVFLKDKAEISVLEGTDKVLGGMPDWASKKALEKLVDMGVEIKLNCPILEVKESEIVCKACSYPFDYLIWTAGVKGVELPGWLKGLKLTSRGQIETNADLSAKGKEGVFCLGDLAEVINPADNSRVPTTAWAAISEGKLVAFNIKQKINDRETKPYIPPESVFVVPIGRRYALTNILGMKLSGFIPYIIKLVVALRYMKSILPLPTALRIWWSGVKES